MLAQALTDPETALLLRRTLAGPVLPFVGGTCNSATFDSGSHDGKIVKFVSVSGSGGACTLGDSVITEDGSGNVGIGTATPGYTLDVNGTIRTQSGYIRGQSTTQGIVLLTADGVLLNNPSGLGGNDLRLGGFYSSVGLYRNAAMELRTDSGDLTLRPQAGDLVMVAASVEAFRIKNDGKVGIGTSSPTNTLSLGGNSAQAFWMERNTTTNTAGNSLTLQGGGATSGATDKNGGDLILKPGVSTGTGTAKIQLQTPSPATSSGTSDRSLATRLEVGEANVTDLESIATHIGARLYQVGLTGQTQSAALYMEVDQGGGTDQIFGIIGEVKSTQVDKYGGFMKVTHKGAGDAIYVPLFTTGGVALEAATFVDNGASGGSKGIISTIQAATPHAGNTLFQALWDKILYAQQRKLKPVNRVVVADSNGKVVGITLGGASVHASSIIGPDNEVRPTVLLAIDDTLVAISVARDRFYAGSVIYFESQGCAGGSWYPTDSTGKPPVLPPAAIGLPGQTLYVEKDGASAQTILTRSRLIDGTQCVNAQFSLPAVPMEPLLDLSTEFTPPFTLKAAP
jgi:hypothetical protein